MRYASGKFSHEVSARNQDDHAALITNRVSEA